MRGSTWLGWIASGLCTDGEISMLDVRSRIPSFHIRL